MQYANITSDDEVQEYIYGHKFVTGLNVCPHDGFFIVYDVASIPNRLPKYLNDRYIRFATFPPDAQKRYPDPRNPYFTVKADRVILSERVPLSEYVTADMVKQNHVCLQHIPRERRTYDMYLDAIRGNYHWLKECEQTEEACLLAVRGSRDALQYIKCPEIKAKILLSMEPMLTYK